MKTAGSLLIFLLVCCAAATVHAEDTWQNVERIVVVGDIHGDYDNYMKVLVAAGLVGEDGDWAAGTTHFVQMGDLPDRGPDTDRVIAHMQQLERQALRSGGRVHALIGNHEAMNMSGDLRYVHPGEYEALKGPRARRLQDAYYEQFIASVQALEEPPVIDAEYRERWNQQYPLGYVEHLTHWSASGKFGSWVLEHNSIIKINNLLFMHGGLGPAYIGQPLSTINSTIRRELQDQAGLENPLFEAEDGPLWYRGLAQNPETTEAAHVQVLLDYYQVDHIIIGHTPGYGTIVPRFDGRVVIVDSGISSYYGSHLASLLIENGLLVNRQGGISIPVPLSRDQLPEYYRQVLTIEPDTESLRTLLQSLENPDTAGQPASDSN